MPKSDTGHQSGGFLIVDRYKLGKLEHFQVIQIPQAKAYALHKGISAGPLQHNIKVLAELGLVGLILQRQAVAQQILVFLSYESIKEIGCYLVIGAVIVRHCLAAHRVQQLLIRHNGNVALPIVFFGIKGDPVHG